ncbi:hypothetical protein V1477_006448 [Vespula maculifrons]|uniref:Uncharacterized protein n=1 Tax=Vespula maculifrons TaxID=7453 RepID=A0ABD2CJX7_VESMC
MERWKKNFSLTIFFSETAAPSRTGPESLESVPRAPCAHIFCVQIGPIENRTLIIGKDTSRPLRPYFLRTDRTNRSRVITHLGEPEQGQWKGSVAPSTPIFFAGNKGKKNFSFTIFFSGTIAHRRTRPGSLERARRALCAHIFLVHIQPIGAERTGPGSFKGLVAPSTPIFFAYRSNLEAPSYNARTRTGPGSLERSRSALYAHISFIQIEPIGAEL